MYHIKKLSKKKALEYYYANKEVICKKSKSKWKSLSPEQEKRQESAKWWLDKQSPEKKEELRHRARDCKKNRYHNHMLQVKE